MAAAKLKAASEAAGMQKLARKDHVKLAPADALYREFTGREPRVEPMLSERGLLMNKHRRAAAPGLERPARPHGST